MDSETWRELETVDTPFDGEEADEASRSIHKDSTCGEVHGTDSEVARGIISSTWFRKHLRMLQKRLVWGLGECGVVWSHQKKQRTDGESSCYIRKLSASY